MSDHKRINIRHSWQRKAALLLAMIMLLSAALPFSVLSVYALPQDQTVGSAVESSESKMSEAKNQAGNADGNISDADDTEAENQTGNTEKDNADTKADISEESTSEADASQVQTVRVGFFAFDGYHVMDEDGNRSGYGYDLLRLLSRYANINFEYVGYDKTWEEAQQMLLDGEIDLLTSAGKTAEREEIFDFSSPVGSRNVEITTRSDETRFVPGDFSTYDGMTLGLITGSTTNEKIEQFAAENGFSYQAEYFGSTDELESALQAEQVDAVATSSLRKTVGERVLSEFDNEDFYAIVRKGDTELLDKVNYAIAQMDAEEGDWRNTLYYQNYSNQVSDQLEFTEEEKAFIEQYSTGGKTLMVATDTNWSPFSVYSQTEKSYSGILIDYWDQLMDMCGINYAYYVPDEGEDIIDATDIEEGNARIYLAYTWTNADADAAELVSTDAFLDADAALVTRKGYKSIKTIALADTTPMLNSRLDLPDSAEVVTYEDSEEAMQAVRQGKADATYVYAYDAQKQLNADNTGLLTYSIIPGLYVSVKMVIPDQEDHTLLSIVSKCMHQMSKADTNSIITSNISYQADKQSFGEYLQLHPNFTLAAVILIVVVIGAIAMLLIYLHTGRKHMREKIAREEEYHKQIEEANQDLRLTLSKEEQYRQATISGAIMTANINVTKNLVEDEIYERIGDQWSPVLETYGLSCPCPLDLYSQTVSQRRVAEESREVYLHAYDRERLLLAFVKGELEHSFEYLRLQKENDQEKKIWVRHTILLTQDPASGDVIGFCSAKDVSGEHEQMDQLLDARKKQSDDLSMIAGLSHEYYILMMISTDDFRIQIYQDNFYRMHRAVTDLGIDGDYYDAFIEDYIARFVLEDDKERVTRETSIVYLSQRIPFDGIFTVNFRRISEDGQVTYHQLAYAKAITQDGKENWAFGLRDINTLMRDEQKQKKQLQEALDQAQSANRSKTMLLNNMSHDIRTPMNAIVDYTKLADQYAYDERKVREYLAKIRTSAGHLESLINDVLDLGRIENGSIRLEEKETSLPELFKDIRTIVQADVQARNLELYIDTVGMKDKVIICDKFRLSQILLNLINNAVKYSNPGGTIGLTITQKPSSLLEYATFEFRVQDTGIGISEEFKSRIFEPFAREDKNIKNGIVGTGIGMAITKNLVDVMGGTITVESEVGKGSEFTVSIPFLIGQENSKKDQIPDMKGLRVLVVDDDAQLCLSISKTVRDMGMRSDWTTTGREAMLRTSFARDQKDPFNLIIMDGSMLDMDGVEVVRQICSHAGEQVPKILMTSYDWSEIKTEAMQAGVTAFCSKPLLMSELRESILQIYNS